MIKKRQTDRLVIQFRLKKTNPRVAVVDVVVENGVGWRSPDEPGQPWCGWGTATGGAGRAPPPTPYGTSKCGNPSSLQNNRSNHKQYLLTADRQEDEVYHFQPFLNFDNCQPEVVSDVISGIADQDVGMYVWANLGNSGLKPRRRHFRPFFERWKHPFRSRLYSDVITSVVVDPTGVKVL